MTTALPSTAETKQRTSRGRDLANIILADWFSPERLVNMSQATMELQSAQAGFAIRESCLFLSLRYALAVAPAWPMGDWCGGGCWGWAGEREESRRSERREARGEILPFVDLIARVSSWNPCSLCSAPQEPLLI